MLYIYMLEIIRNKKRKTLVNKKLAHFGSCNIL